MTRKIQRVIWIGLSVTAAIFTASSLAAQTAGEQWEYQGTMEMMGMKMPIPPSKQCQRPDAAKTPPVQNNCKLSDVQVRGNTTSYKIQCGPPQPMEGSGQTVSTGDRLDATYKMKMAEGEMTYVMTGKKTGSCTP